VSNLTQNETFKKPSEIVQLWSWKAC